MAQEGRRKVYDIGAHTGEDTAYYLQQGFDVVAVEANPLLIGHLNRRFTESITNKRLAVVHTAITTHAVDTIPFFVAPEPGESSLTPDRMIAAGTSYKTINTPACTLEKLFSEYGKGYYCKMDIEGGDIPALKSLPTSNDLPDFFSTELSCLPISLLNEKVSELYAALEEFLRLNFTKFKLVDQYTLATLDHKPFYSKQRLLSTRLLRLMMKSTGHVRFSFNLRAWYSRRKSYQFTTDSSGVFGNDIVGEWAEASEMREIIRDRFLEYYQHETDKRHIFWVDLHAAR